MGYPIPSPMVLRPFTEAYRKTVEQYAKEQGLEIVSFAKDADKDQIAREHLKEYPGKQGVVLIGKAQEKALGYKGIRKDRGTEGVVQLLPPKLFRHVLLFLHIG